MSKLISGRYMLEDRQECRGVLRPAELGEGNDARGVVDEGDQINYRGAGDERGRYLEEPLHVGLCRTRTGGSWPLGHGRLGRYMSPRGRDGRFVCG
jgi:hypothetical protein